MPYLADFVHYSSGLECPEKFLTWSGLTLIGAVAGPKLWTSHSDYFQVYPNLNTVLVGTSGSGKSTAMGQAEDIFVKNFPDYMVSESIQSREDILKKMSRDECAKTYPIGAGRYAEYRPFFCIVDEMENFISVDDKKMVGFLVGIYGRTNKSFGTGFKNDVNPNQRITGPYLSLLACTVPDWMMSSLRMSLFTGGLGRRLIIVHCQKDKDVPHPTRPADHEATMSRIVAHLKQVEQACGQLHWTPSAKKWWGRWYMDKGRKNMDDPILIQFDETKHIQLLKVASLLALSEPGLKLEIDEDHMEFARILLDDLSRDITRLTSGIGRNELAGVGAQVIDHINRMGGAVPEVQLKKFFFRYLNDPEFIALLNHYISTEQLLLTADEKTGRRFYMTPEYYREYLNKKNRPTETPSVPSPSSSDGG